MSANWYAWAGGARRECYRVAPYQCRVLPCQARRTSCEQLAVLQRDDATAHDAADTA